MNILIISSGGIPSENPGLQVMRDTVKTLWKDATVVALTTSEDDAWGGAGSKRDATALQPSDLETELDAHYVYGASPSDLVDLAYLQSDLFLTRAQANWDFVLVGLDKGPVTSVPDSIRHAGVSAGLYAAAAYGAAALTTTWDGDRAPPPHAWDALRSTMRANYAGAGETLILNIPAQQPTKLEFGPLSHYSTLRLPPPSIVPRAREDRSASALIKSGAITLTKTAIRLNPELRY